MRFQSIAFQGITAAALLLLGGCTWTSIARGKFASAHRCPSEQVKVGPAMEDPYGPGVQTFDVSGCDDEVRYRCYTHGSVHTGGTYSDCDEIKRESYRATDGSLHQDWPVVPSGSGADAHEAAIASAAHDLPCDRRRIVVVDERNLILEGCGQRITYQTVGDMTENGRRYLLVGRIPIPGAPAPSPSAAPPAPPTTQ
jgi:hypothetical protein